MDRHVESAAGGHGRAATALRHASGILELVGRVGDEITALVQEVHAATSPWAVARGRQPAPHVYGPLRLAFRGAGWAAAWGGRLAPPDPSPDRWLDVQSALLGAFGHHFRAEGGFALPLALRRAPPCETAPRLVLFLHGLCMNERAWRAPAHVAFAAWAREELGAEVAYVRYNTGLRISANGAALAERLENVRLPTELFLVGHSMGGLVARSALLHARARGHAWPDRVSGLACLGSPHAGARLERLGNHANRMLRASPWTRPFMRLGELRSDGIRDLRFGHLLEHEWRGRAPDDPRRPPEAAPWDPDVDHLLIAALRQGGRETDPVGDWLVPVESALARTLHPHAPARRELLRDLDHLGLLADPRVYARLRDWLAERAGTV